MAKLNEELLAKYHDGELSDRKAKWVEEQLENSPEYQETLNKMNRMGRLLRLMHEESVSDVSFDGFSERIMMEVEADERPRLIERIRVWVEEFAEHRQKIWLPTAAIAAAAVAVLLIFPLSNGNPSQKSQVTQGSHGGGGDLVYYADRAKVSYSSAIESVAHGKTDVQQYKLNYGKKSEVGVVWIRESQ